ncbi:DUF7419 family protein [Mycolicibacterium bacteremicum]
MSDLSQILAVQASFLTASPTCPRCWLPHCNHERPNQ